MHALLIGLPLSTMICQWPSSNQASACMHCAQQIFGLSSSLYVSAGVCRACASRQNDAGYQIRARASSSLGSNLLARLTGELAGYFCVSTATPNSRHLAVLFECYFVDLESCSILPALHHYQKIVLQTQNNCYRDNSTHCSYATIFKPTSACHAASNGNFGIQS